MTGAFAMPRTADASNAVVASILPNACSLNAGTPSDAASLAPADRGFVLQLQRQALQYFVDNQVSDGLILDRQRNYGPRCTQGLCSTAATGMGFIALALAAAPPYRLLTPQAAALRIRAGLLTALERLPHDHGVIPHFIDSATGAVYGTDYLSTVETAWLLTGALWSASFLRDSGLESLAESFYDRVNWQYWTAHDGRAAKELLRHGKGRDGRFLACCWDRLNGETVFMYLLAAGAAEGRALSATSWSSLQPFYGTVAGLRFNNADLGLFVFQYGLDLLDLRRWKAPGEVDLMAEAKIATIANHRVCREFAPRFHTYHQYWGLSAGDGPGDGREPDSYRCYAPGAGVDGTAHVQATLAAIAHAPALVLENLRTAQHDRQLPARGRYGFSNVNVDQMWVGRDMVGIDAGAVVLALDNFLMHDRVREVFHSLSCVQKGLGRLGCVPTSTDLTAPANSAEEVPVLRQAS
jgi:hypothetical protein